MKQIASFTLLKIKSLSTCIENDYNVFRLLFCALKCHQAQVSKDRTQLFGDQIFQITEYTGEKIIEWLNGQKNVQSDEHRKVVHELNGL